MKGIIELFKMLERNNCKVLHFADDEYKVTTDRKVVTAKEFEDNKDDELGEPKLVFSENKIKASIRFKKSGGVDLNGVGIKSSTWTSKNIFIDNEAYMKNIGVVVPVENLDLVKRVLDRDKKIVQCSEVDRDIDKGKVTLSLDISKMQIVDVAKRDRIIQEMSDPDYLCQIFERLQIQKLLNKALLEILRRAKSEIPITEMASDKLSIFTDTTLENLVKAGMNISTGMYDKTEDAGDKAIKSDVKSMEVTFKMPEIDDSKLTAKVLVDGDAFKLIADAGYGLYANVASRKIQQWNTQLSKLACKATAGHYKEAKDILKDMQDAQAIIKANLESFKYKLWLYKVVLIMDDEPRGWKLEKTGRTGKKIYGHEANADRIKLEISNRT